MPGARFRRGQAIHNRAHPHVAELLVISHLRIQQDGPSAGGAYAQEARVGRRIQLIQRGGIALGEQRIGTRASGSQTWSAHGANAGLEIERVGRPYGTRQAERLHAQPSRAGEGGGIERDAAQPDWYGVRECGAGIARGGPL